MDYTSNEQLGSEIVKLLNLKIGKNGLIETSWGTKSLEGLGACIKRLVEDNENK